MACKAHLYEGGRLRVNKNAWFAHLFRTAAGFSFPYHMSHGQTEAARTHSRDLWLNNKWPKAARPLSALLDQFWPIPGWSDDALSKLKDGEKGRKQWHVPAVVEPLANPRYIKSAPDSGLTYGIVYYTENRCPEPIFSTVQEQLKRCVNGNQIASVSLKPIDFGDNVVLNLERGYRTMFEQILTGLANLDTDFAFLCEHDVLYSPEHFKFIPPRRNVYYYNEHVYLVSAQTGQSLYYEHRSVSQLVADRRLLLDHYRERLARIEKEGFSYRNGFEPGTRKLASGGYDNFPAHSFFSSRPNVDIRDTGVNLTKTLWHREQFRNQKFTVGWTLGGTIPTWGHTEGRFNDWLAEVRAGGK